MTAPEQRADFPPRRALLLVTALAFSVRLGACLLKAVIAADSYHYARIARLIADGQWNEALAQGYHPGYTTLVAAFLWLLRDVSLAGHAVSIVMGTLVVLPAWSLGRATAGPRGALFAALLLALLPEAVDVGSDMLVEATFLTLFLGSIALAVRSAERAEWISGVGSGVLCAASYLVRPEGLAAGVVAAPLILFAGWRASDPQWKRRILAAAAAGGAMVLCVLPYVLWLKGHHGRWTISGKAGARAFQSEIQKTTDGNVSESAEKMKAKRSRNPLALPYEFLRSLAKAVWPPFVVLLLAAPFFRDDLRRVPWAACAAVLAVYLPALFRVLFANNELSTRHLLAPAAILLVFAGAHAAARLSLRWKQGLAGLILAIALVSLPKTLRPDRWEEVPQRDAGLWMREHAPGVVFAGPEKCAFYAGAPTFIRVPSGAGPQPIAETLREHRTAWLLLLEEDNAGVAASLDPRFELRIAFGEGRDRVAIFHFSP